MAAAENFQQIMARLRAREKALNESFAALEEEFRTFANDHGEFLLTMERQIIAQDVVREVLSSFDSPQIDAPPAAASTTEAQNPEHGDPVSVSEDARLEEPLPVPPLPQSE